MTTNRGQDNAPRVSPDGTRLAFQSYRQGSPDIWLLPLDAGPAAQLTSTPWPDMYPAWSPDGRMVAFYGSRSNADSINLFVMPADGGEPRQITTGNSSKYFPQWSPDARQIFFASDAGSGKHRIFRIPAEGGLPEEVTTAPAYYFRWSPDGTRLYFPGTERGSNDLWELTLATRRERRLTRFPTGIGKLGALALAASKTHLYFTVRKDVGDLWVMDVLAGDEGMSR